MIDLHLHTNYSDGSLCPAEVVRRASRIPLKAIAITDHDTISGVEEALAEGRALGIEVIPGIELSCKFQERELHLLGYHVDFKNPKLIRHLADFRAERMNHLPKILNRLKELGIDLKAEEVCIHASAGYVGRPHIARAMVAKGYTETMEASFTKYLRDGGPAHIPRKRWPLSEAIGLLKEARAIPVLAHPGIYGINGQQIRNFKKMGISGIECHYPRHKKGQINQYREIARKMNLIITGGSDFHGDFPSRIKMGAATAPEDSIVKLAALAGDRVSRPN